MAWCPSCRSEWRPEVGDVCPDCTVALLKELPPKPSPVRLSPERPHEVAAIDVAAVDESTRWRIDLALEQAGVAREWNGDTLRVPVDARDLVEETRDEAPTIEPATLPSDSEPPEPSMPGLSRVGAWGIDAASTFAAATLVGIAASRPDPR